HVAVEFVGEQRIAQLNREHRGKPEPTDVLSFPIDGVHETPPDATGAAGQGELAAVAPRELGDIVICPEHTADLREAVVHGMLHLLGMDHETDSGEMLALQRELLVHGAQ
ncbi:MAG TPA: rRNA maturation RNase YbeY, partial [Solirubrobacteraceae bacterium]|nr:rRNA maturation RNase YbeY [Solirubrobacteraceae bacterium]